MLINKNFSKYDSFSYLTIKQKAIELEDLFCKNGLKRYLNSDLSKLIKKTCELIEAGYPDNDSLER